MVEQNKKEDPASVLLKKIKAEKEKLIAEKKLKNGKYLPPIKAEEIPFEILENWVWCRLGEIFKFIDYRGKTPTRIADGVRLISAKILDSVTSTIIRLNIYLHLNMTNGWLEDFLEMVTFFLLLRGTLWAL